LAKSKGLLPFLYEGSDNVESEFSLFDAVLGLSPRLFCGVLNQLDLLSRSVTTLSQSLPTGRNFAIDVLDKLARYPFVLNMSIAVGKATPLLGGLIRGHLNFSSSLNEFFEFFCHCRVS
jgi:hypothetical protein